MFRYVRVQEGEPFANIGDFSPFKAIVIIEHRPSPEWQSEASTWLVDSGCLYMMAWGEDCASWDDSVDWVNLNQFDFGDIPDSAFVMTTWHDEESLPEVFHFAKESADHPTVSLDNTLVLHIGVTDRHQEYEELFSKP